MENNILTDNLNEEYKQRDETGIWLFNWCMLRSLTGLALYKVLGVFEIFFTIVYTLLSLSDLVNLTKLNILNILLYFVY